MPVPPRRYDDMRKLRYILVALCALQCLATASGHSFDADWRFRFADPDADYSSVHVSTEEWTPVTLPHTPRYEDYALVRQWQGICWYAKEFEIDGRVSGKRFILTFDGAMNVADVWINGVHCTRHSGGYLPVVVDITDDVHRGYNRIAVRLDNNDNRMTGPKPVSQLDYFLYGGLYRSAHLTVKDDVRITDPFLDATPAAGGVFVSYDNVGRDSADVNVRVSVANGRRRNVEVRVVNILSYGGREVARSAATQSVAAEATVIAETKMVVKEPLLWSPQSPHLYTLRTVVEADGRQTDSESRRIGIRSIEIKDKELYVNGRRCFLRGVNRHQSYPYVGNALCDNAQRRDAVKIKEAGFDYVRLSHYPQSPAFLDACDSLGIFVLDAISGWQFFDDSEEFALHQYRSARELIRRDRNRPCVLAWELSLNETAMPRDFIERMNDILREEYPAPYCYSAGWKKGYDIYLEARQHRIKYRTKEYDAPLIVSEYGDWEFYAIDEGFMQHKMRWFQKPELTSRQLREYGERRMLQQLENIVVAHADNVQAVPAMADGYWAMFDYNRGLASDIESSGIMSLDRLPKYSYYYFRSLREGGEPMVFIASNFDKDTGRKVTVISNCESVTLCLDGKETGECRLDTASMPRRTVAEFELPEDAANFSVLTAKGRIGGRDVASHTLRRPEKPSAIELVCDESGVKLGRNDMAFVYVRLVDRNGTAIFENGREVFLSVEGDAAVAGSRFSPLRGGTASFLVRTGMRGGEVVLTVQCGNFRTSKRLYIDF